MNILRCSIHCVHDIQLDGDETILFMLTKN